MPTSAIDPGNRGKPNPTAEQLRVQRLLLADMAAPPKYTDMVTIVPGDEAFKHAHGDEPCDAFVPYNAATPAVLDVLADAEMTTARFAWGMAFALTTYAPDRWTFLKRAWTWWRKARATRRLARAARRAGP